MHRSTEREKERKRERGRDKEKEEREKQITVTAGPFWGIISNYSYRRASAGELILHYITVGAFPGIRNVIIIVSMVDIQCNHLWSWMRRAPVTSDWWSAKKQLFQSRPPVIIPHKKKNFSNANHAHTTFLAPDIGNKTHVPTEQGTIKRKHLPGPTH